MDWLLDLESSYFEYAKVPGCVHDDSQKNKTLTKAACADIGQELGYTICFEKIFNKKTKWD